MDKCPDEVLIKVCGWLDFQSLANVRLVNKRLAEVGAEALVKRVRFHCTQDSLKRLHAIAQHDVFCKYVDTIVFEGNLLASVPCIHTYQTHYEMDHHQNERPRLPPKHATPRERRLYERNVAKFKRELKEKYDRYLDLYDKQQKVLKSPAYADFISSSMPCFPRLNKLVLSTVGRCKHVLSGRFLESFTADCAMPIEHDTSFTKDQLKHLLFPQGRPLTQLGTLEVHVMSPKFFTGFVPADLIRRAFQNLKVIDLNFRLEKDDRIGLDIMTADRCYADLAKGCLRDALTAARDLEQLTINFDDYGYYGAVTSLENILGSNAWPRLNMLNLDCMSTTEDYFLGMLKRQSSLRDLRLGFMTLEQGRWPSATTRMRKDLDLINFMASGILEDPDEMFPMHLLDTEAYVEDHHHFTLGDALGLYVADEFGIHEEEGYHPLLDDDFTDEETLREEYGPFADDDDFSDMDCSD
ncbi:uncharacterized protein PV07_10275 [Cladophialophora immunda]|uniref:F-box domain-containing protein n=1 Tax=Cladophialophora immunda TaxID=569365 RepID=A0A0D2AI48_9EURO|nr:uncharacterized protein PV07_10275 [Cladophialophora immunda]KIW24567.1 hypothetical protein PV07_10275 [Cladophialophora immunda]OQV09939.1 hypothetical protein CLAIMM_14011 [Cladophialophora immunda]